jgi:hypothetical protein
VLHSQFVKVRGHSIGFIRVGPGFDEFFFKVVIDCFVWSGRSGNGQNPVLRTSFPLVDVRATHVSESVGDFLPGIHHKWMHSVHKLVEAEFVKKVVGLLSVSVEGEGLLSLEGFFVS